MTGAVRDAAVRYGDDTGKVRTNGLAKLGEGLVPCPDCARPAAREATAPVSTRRGPRLRRAR